MSNEEKLKRAEKDYRWLTIIAEFLPVLVALLQIVILSVCITMVIYLAKIQESEQRQDETREGILQYRAERRATEQTIINNQIIIIKLLSKDSVIKK